MVAAIRTHIDFDYLRVLRGFGEVATGLVGAVVLVAAGLGLLVP